VGARAPGSGRAILAELAPGGATSVHAPETELALVDVARAFVATVTTDADERPVGPASAAAARPANGLRSRFRGLVRGRAPSSPAEPGPPAPPTTALDLRARIEPTASGRLDQGPDPRRDPGMVDDADGDPTPRRSARGSGHRAAPRDRRSTCRDRHGSTHPRPDHPPPRTLPRSRPTRTFFPPRCS
jgi:hypothetical protein